MRIRVNKLQLKQAPAQWKSAIKCTDRTTLLVEIKQWKCENDLIYLGKPHPHRVVVDPWIVISGCIRRMCFLNWSYSMVQFRRMQRHGNNCRAPVIFPSCGGWRPNYNMVELCTGRGWVGEDPNDPWCGFKEKYRCSLPRPTEKALWANFPSFPYEEVINKWDFNCRDTAHLLCQNTPTGLLMGLCGWIKGKARATWVNVFTV